MKKKSLALILAMALLVVGIIGGTVAWLTDTSQQVVNTFTTSDIDITLTETGATDNKNSYKMVPGHTISKDPQVTVEAGSEACYLFVKLEKSDNFDQFLTYEMAEGWNVLNGVDDVYYRTVLNTTADSTFSVLKNDQVSVKGTVTKADMNRLTEENYPTLTVTAYAHQYYQNTNVAFDVTEAWESISSASGN